MSGDDIDAERIIPIDAERKKLTAKKFGDSSHVILPKSWLGEDVLVIKIDDDRDRETRFEAEEDGGE